MSLTSQLTNLNTVQLKSLHNTMLDASIAHETGGNSREIFRRAKYRHVGLMNRIYKLLSTASKEEIDTLSGQLTEMEL